MGLVLLASCLGRLIGSSWIDPRSFRHLNCDLILHRRASGMYLNAIFLYEFMKKRHCPATSSSLAGLLLISMSNYLSNLTDQLCLCTLSELRFAHSMHSFIFSSFLIDSLLFFFLTLNLTPRSSNIILPDPFFSLVMRYTVICWLEVSPRAKKKEKKRKRGEENKGGAIASTHLISRQEIKGCHS